MFYHLFYQGNDIVLIFYRQFLHLTINNNNNILLYIYTIPIKFISLGISCWLFLIYDCFNCSNVISSSLLSNKALLNYKNNISNNI